MTHPDILKIFFEGQEEYLKVINSNESIVKALSDVKNPVCPLIGTDIKLVKKLGEGKAGVAFEIDFPDRGTRRYVAKRANVALNMFDIFGAPPPGFRSKTFLDIQETTGVSAPVIIAYNNLKAQPTDSIVQDIIVPLFKKGCSIRRDHKIPRLDRRGIVTLHPGDHMCETAYTEFAISLLVGELYRSSISINFLDTFYFATCINGNRLTDVRQYTFMERIDRSLRNAIGCVAEYNHKGFKNPGYHPEAMECICIQILHAIGMYQEKYQIVHGDLHDDNVFLEYVNAATKWNGKSVLDVDYFQYNVGASKLFLPGGRECPFIVKIGDWGIACKYSTPKIVETTTINSGYDQEDGYGPWLPNFYTQAYDPVFIVNILRDLNPSNEFIQSIVAWMFGLNPGYTNDDITAAKKKIYSAETRRPRIELLSTKLAHVTPMAILTNPTLMGKYLDPAIIPEHSILLGTVIG